MNGVAIPPSTDVLIKLAGILDVSLDYIAFDGRQEKTIARIADREPMQAIQEIDQLPTEDRDTIKAVLNTFIIKNRFQRLASETQKHTAAN